MKLIKRGSFTKIHKTYYPNGKVRNSLKIHKDPDYGVDINFNVPEVLKASIEYLLQRVFESTGLYLPPHNFPKKH